MAMFEECSMIECVSQEHESKPKEVFEQNLEQVDNDISLVKLNMSSLKGRKKVKVRRKKRRCKCWK